MSLWDLAWASLAPAVPSFYPRALHPTGSPAFHPPSRWLCVPGTAVLEDGGGLQEVTG